MYRESNITSSSSLFSQQLPTASCSYTCINVKGVEQGWPRVVLTALVNLYRTGADSPSRASGACDMPGVSWQLFLADVTRTQ
jgi:hypothetical protein